MSQPSSFVPAPSSQASIDKILERVSSAPLRLGNQLHILQNGPQTYADWLTAIRQAQHWIHLENYIFAGDTIGHLFADALRERAAAGVSVRVIYDWLGSYDTPRSFWQQLRRGGVDVRVVNPLNLRNPFAVLQRDHRKMLAVDGVYASTGGVCIADEWNHTMPDTGLPYRDTAVSVRGPAVADLEHAFASIWQHIGAPLPPEECPAVEQIAAAGDEAVRVIMQQPGRMRILRLLELLTASVQRRLWIADAYFLSLPVLNESLKAAAQDGVDVRILLPATNDLALVGALARTGYRPLLEAGVRIWEYSGLMMHAKTTVVDGWWSRIGSTNLNIASLTNNWELDLVAEDREFGATMEAMFEADLANAREIRLTGTPAKPKAQPERPLKRGTRELGSLGSGSKTLATASRIGSAVLTSEYLDEHERAVVAAGTATMLGVSLVGFRLPRILAWPLALLSGMVGLAGVNQLFRRKREDKKPGARP